MSGNSFTRRKFIVTTATAVVAIPLVGRTTVAQLSARPNPGEFPVRSISSANGLRSVERAVARIKAGDDTLDAVIAGVNMIEDDPDDISVGLGGLPNEDGVVELDSAVMHGPSHLAGAVAALQNVRNPSSVAKLVLEQTDHVLIVGEGALRFARAHGFIEENLLTDKTRKIWLKWKQTMSERDDWVPPSENGLPRLDEIDAVHTDGTVHCAAMNANGDISCTTTTSGLAFKIPGRVGDSPIIGAGLYVDNEIGSCGSTGRGEANLQNLCSFAAVEFMRGGMSPKDAGMEVLRRVASHVSEKRLLDEKGRPNFGLKFYLLAKDGRYAGVTMWGPAKFSVCDESGARHEDCEALFVQE